MTGMPAQTAIPNSQEEIPAPKIGRFALCVRSRFAGSLSCVWVLRQRLQLRMSMANRNNKNKETF